MRRPTGRLTLPRMLDNYIRERIEEAIAELDIPEYEKALEARSLNPPGLRFETILEKSGKTLEELQEVVAALKAEKLIAHLEGWKHLSITNDFRRKHGYYRG